MAYSHDFTPKARQSLLDAKAYAANSGPTTAAAFGRAFADTLAAICEEDAPRKALDEVGSLAFSRPAFMERFTTAKRRRRGSNAGVWRLYYSLDDTDGDGKPDTVLILLIKHAASEPLTAWMDAPSGEPESGE